MATIVKPPKKKHVVCDQCEATIAYLPEDIQTRHGHDYSGGDDGWERVKCPREKCPGYGYINRW